MNTECKWEDIMAVEDSLQEAEVFLNGFSQKPCHSDSYMTLVSYEALARWSATQIFERSVIEGCITYWETNPNMQPPLRLVAAQLRRNLLNQLPQPAATAA